MKRIAYIAAIIALLLDQLTKFVVVQTMSIGQDIPIIDGFFHLTYYRNTGAAWSMLEGKMVFFYVITIFALGFFVYYINKLTEKQLILSLGLGLMLGGALGNFIDRLLFQSVVDFLNFYIFSYDYPIFNIADVSLVVGIGLILLDTLLEVKKEKQNEKGYINN